MIIFNDVTKQFGDGTIGLEDVTFNVDPGEMLVITGPSGAGKTTLMRLITKEYEPTLGQIVFDHEPLSDVRPSRVHQHRRQIGVVYQDYQLLDDLNVWENIALALDILGMPQTEIEERVTDLLDLVGLTEKAYLFPKQLSGGEAQRVSIARALAPAPKVIFADEPTGNLDAKTSHLIAELFRKINELGTTIMLSTHDQNVLDVLAKRVLELDQGRVVNDSGNSTQSTPKTTKNSVEPDDSSKTEKVTEDATQETVEITIEETPSSTKQARSKKVTIKKNKKGKIQIKKSNRISQWFSSLFSFGSKTDASDQEKSEEKTTQPEKVETPPESEKPAKLDKPNKPEKSEKPGLSEKPDKNEKIEVKEKKESKEKIEKKEKNEKKEDSDDSDTVTIKIEGL